MSVRTDIANAIKPSLPVEWRFIPNQRLPQTLSVVTVVMKMQDIEPLAEAPIGNLRTTLTLSVVSPHKDEVKAEIALDENVLDVLLAIDGHSWLNWTGARKVSFDGNYLGWDITLNAITSKEN